MEEFFGYKKLTGITKDFLNSFGNWLFLLFFCGFFGSFFFFYFPSRIWKLMFPWLFHHLLVHSSNTWVGKKEVTFEQNHFN